MDRPVRGFMFTIAWARIRAFAHGLRVRLEDVAISFHYIRHETDTSADILCPPARFSQHRACAGSGTTASGRGYIGSRPGCGIAKERRRGGLDSGKRADRGARRTIGRGSVSAARISASSCVVNAPALGDDELPDGIVNGKEIKNARALERLRKKTKGVLHIGGGDLSGEKMEGRDLYDICFYSTKLTQTNWDGFSGSGLGFIGTDLTGATLTRAKMPYALFRDTKLADVNATGADLRYGRLDGGWSGSMRNLNLDGAELLGFRVECGVTRLDGCPVDRQGLSLRGADLTKASFYPFYFPDVDTTGVILDQTEVGLDHLSRFKGAKLVGSLVVRSANAAAIFLPGEIAQLRSAMFGGPARPGASAPTGCPKTMTVLERVICASPDAELRRLASDVKQMDETMLSNNPRHAASIKRWENERNQCALMAEADIAACLRSAYLERRGELAERAEDKPNWIAPNSFALFMAGIGPVPERVTRSELFGRILPVLLDSTQALVLVKVDGKGLISLKGQALGGCSIAGDDLRYEPDTGWVAGGGRPAQRRRAAVAGTPVVQMQGDELVVFQNGQGDAVAGNPYISCGDNGSFVPMRQVPIGDAQLARLWDIN